MRNLVIIINGVGGSGKDTFCNFTLEKYKGKSIDSVSMVKEAAKVLGWDGVKDNSSRKMLADLKEIDDIYFDARFKYCTAVIKQFMESKDLLLFIHCREPYFIKRLQAYCGDDCVTLLVDRNNVKSIVFNNLADDNVYSMSYDYCYHNDFSIDTMRKESIILVEKMLKDKNIRL